MNQEAFIENRNRWLENVSDSCHEYATKSNLDFYVFQTPCDNYNPKLLIIGINPGGGKSYSELLKEKGYSKRSASNLAYDVNTLTTKPQWEIDAKLKGSDVMRNRLKRIFSAETGLGEVLKNTVMMNMFYFNTPKEKDLQILPDEAKQYCLDKTLEFIEILNPKNVLFLTSQKSNLKMCKVTDIKKEGSIVQSGVLNHRQVSIIPHYGSYAYYSNEKASVMGKELNKLFK